MVASSAVTPEEVPPQTGRHAQIASLTGLRGFAALMVVLIHVSVLTEYPWLGIPDYGPVSLFVLSGFLLYRPWARWSLRIGARPSVRSFAIRRVLRIFPAYLVMLVVVAAIEPLARPDGAGAWLRAATLTWIYHSGDFRTATQQTWSLGTELSWYVALPVIGLVTGVLARRRPGRPGFLLVITLMATALPASWGWRWWVHMEELGQYFTYPYWLPGYLFCFASGALVAHLTEGRRAGTVSLTTLRRAAADPWLLPVVGLAVVLLGTSSLGGPSGFRDAISLSEHTVRAACATALATTLLVGAVFGPSHSPLNRLLQRRWFTAVGRWSYGIYLWHVPVLVILDGDVSFPSGPAGLLLRLAVVLAVSVLLGAATYAWVERPAIAWSRRLDRARGPRSDTATTTSHPVTATATPARSVPVGE